MATVISSQSSYIEIWASLESADNATMKEVLATHSHDGRKVDVKPILTIIENILLRATPSLSDHAPTGSLETIAEDKISQPDSVVKLKALTDVIKKISTELVFSSKNVFVTATVDGSSTSLKPIGTKMICNCKYPGGGDVFATTMNLLKILSNYSWDAKVVLTLAAFALNHGEFFLFTHRYANGSSLPHSITLLKQLRDITEYSQLSKPIYDEIVKLVNVIMGVAKCIVGFNDLLLQEGIATKVPPFSVAMDYIAKAAYWAILSTVICASHIASLKLSQESTQLWDLSRLSIEGTRIQELLKNQLTISKGQIEGQIAEKSKTAYWHLVRDICDVRQPDSMKILKTLIFDKHDWQHLVDGSHRRINVEELRDKTVLLLISGLDLSKEEISILNKFYQESQMKPDIQYQIVWIPVLGKSITWDQEKQEKFDQLLSSMLWYSVPEPSQIKLEVIKYIKKVWQYTGKMTLVPLDPQGRVQSMNALDILWIWGNSGFPFSHGKEEALWETQSWTIELLVASIDRTIVNWVAQGKLVCFYGGEDIDWIREFTAAAKAAALAAGIALELVYVGKNNSIKEVEKVTKIIDAEKLSYCWTDLTSTRFFWTRLESMLYLKMQQGKNLKNDSIMREVTTLLAYDGSDKGWAQLWKGTYSTIAKGDVVLKSLNQFLEWKDDAKAKGFLPALNAYFQRQQATQSCTRIILTGNRPEIPSNVLTGTGCDCSMEKCFLYRCYL